MGGRPFLVPVLMRAIEMMQERIATETTAPTVLITPTFPNLPDARLRRFREGRRYIESGSEAADAALPRLAAMLPWFEADRRQDGGQGAEGGALSCFPSSTAGDCGDAGTELREPPPQRSVAGARAAHPSPE